MAWDRMKITAGRAMPHDDHCDLQAVARHIASA
jgi:hypothetical protein